jgi:hypothetical protein
VPQNQVDISLSVVPQNRRREIDVEYVSRSSGLLRLKASRIRVSQFGFKTGGGVTVGGTHDIIMEVVLR